MALGETTVLRTKAVFVKLGNLQVLGPWVSVFTSTPSPSSPWPLYILLQQGPGGP